MKKIIMAMAVVLAFPAAVHGQDSYTINQGDTFSNISGNLNVSYSNVVQFVQDWENVDFFYPGQDIPEQEEQQNNEEAPNESGEEEASDEADTENGSNPSDAQEPTSEEQNTEDVPNEEPSEEADVEETPAEGNSEEVSEEPNAAQDNSSDNDVQSESEFEQEVIQLTNQEREQAGLDPLQSYSELSDVARDKSKDMRDAGYFDHNSPNYGSPFDMMDTYGIEYSGGGENIAAGQRSPEEVVEGWMNSQGHRENILNSDFTHIGVGHAEGGSYGDYWTQMFVTK
ncbi:putative YkwD family protein [Salibacterium salarium]|uniref:CAP domain-containing protein n=1 Tax=Salibacterium salarium TaxID=284579 RepID=UPI0027808B6B|nr:CAP domain-containing protein [Salibacterium salarium]MDQ0299945.1 putative YkwD family protein [Salibacterium salarium]